MLTPSPFPYPTARNQYQGVIAPQASSEGMSVGMMALAAVGVVGLLWFLLKRDYGTPQVEGGDWEWNEPSYTPNRSRRRGRRRSSRRRGRSAARKSRSTRSTRKRSRRGRSSDGWMDVPVSIRSVPSRGGGRTTTFTYADGRVVTKHRSRKEHEARRKEIRARMNKRASDAKAIARKKGLSAAEISWASGLIHSDEADYPGELAAKWVSLVRGKTRLRRNGKGSYGSRHARNPGVNVSPSEYDYRHGSTWAGAVTTKGGPTIRRRRHSGVTRILQSGREEPKGMHQAESELYGRGVPTHVIRRALDKALRGLSQDELWGMSKSDALARLYATGEIPSYMRANKRSAWASYTPNLASSPVIDVAHTTVPMPYRRATNSLALKGMSKREAVRLIDIALERSPGLLERGSVALAEAAFSIRNEVLPGQRADRPTFVPNRKSGRHSGGRSCRPTPRRCPTDRAGAIRWLSEQLCVSKSKATSLLGRYGSRGRSRVDLGNVEHIVEMYSQFGEGGLSTYPYKTRASHAGVERSRGARKRLTRKRRRGRGRRW